MGASRQTRRPPQRGHKDDVRSSPEPAFQPSLGRRRPSAAASAGGAGTAKPPSAQDTAALTARLRHLPSAPGVYRFLDTQGETIYVGKAKNLRARVRSYFRSTPGDSRLLYPFLIRRIADVDVVVTSNEKEALLLENHLIKRHQPRYNVRLADDKTYPLIKVTTNEEWPRVQLVRRRRKDSAVYFGPCASTSAARQALRILKRYFPLRTCSNAEFRQRLRPCIEYDMDRCHAPCVGLEDQHSYQRSVAEVIQFLGGGGEDLLGQLRTDMEARAQKLDFESAARLRDRITALEKTLERQVISRPGNSERDAFGVAMGPGLAHVQVLEIRDGKVVNSHDHALRLDPDAQPGPQSLEKVLEAFLGQYYAPETGRLVPRELLLGTTLTDTAALAQMLADRRGARVALSHPKRGEKLELVQMATRNAAMALARSQQRHVAMGESLQRLQERLGLRHLPETIECVDISNIQGTLAVGSMVRFELGEPCKARYRRFRIRSVEGANDFAMMAEVISRRFENTSRHGDAPDLVVVDGGRGQLGAAAKALEKLGYQLPTGAAAAARPDRGMAPDLVGLAKARSGPTARGTARAFERVFRLGSSHPLVLAPDTAECHLLERVRDEAHRFAIGYHRDLRSRSSLRAGLEDVPGIGSKRRRNLLRHFGSLKAIRQADAQALQAAPSMTRAAAEALYAWLNQPDAAAAEKSDEVRLSRD